MSDQSDSFDEFLSGRLDAKIRDDAKNNSAVICDAAPGNQVIYVSESFEEHTGYSPEEAIGKNLSFLQGPASETVAIEKFRDLIHNERIGSVTITNYRKDGSLFRHQCELRPVRDAEGVVTHFIAIQRLA